MENKKSVKELLEIGNITVARLKLMNKISVSAYIKLTDKEIDEQIKEFLFEPISSSRHTLEDRNT
jgi:hypothetical protein